MAVVFGIVLFVTAALLWFIPIFMIAKSTRVSGGEKLVWLLLVLFLSWFVWILYVLLAPLSKQERQSSGQ